jgi:hypothetical protein
MGEPLQRRRPGCPTSDRRIDQFPHRAGPAVALNSRRDGRVRSGAEPSVPSNVAAQSLRCPPSLLRQSSAFRAGKAAARPMYLFGLRPLHLCGTRLEGGHRRLSRTLRLAWVEPKRGSIVGRHAGTGAMKVIGNQVPATASASPWCSENSRGRRRHHATALLPLNRIVVRDLGVHPRGEFRTSERP